jgi:hypothetical protein
MAIEQFSSRVMMAVILLITFQKETRVLNMKFATSLTTNTITGDAYR